MAMENPKVIKKGDQVITNYVDEKTGKIAAYEVGIKLEVSDFSGQWFPAKIVEVDKGEKEVLVHFENWSARFDEWIKMDSNRLRPSPNTNIVKTQFKVGESVEALWNTDGQRYPGVIQNILPNDYYQVLFDDGIKLKKKYNQIFKLKPATRKSGSSSTSATPAVPSTSKANTEPVVPNPTLPELTPFSQMVTPVPADQSQPLGPKVTSLQPPPLIPKPKPKPITKRSTGSNSLLKPQPLPPSDALPLPSPVPELPVVKKVIRRSRKVPPPPSPLPSTPAPPVLSTAEISTPPDVLTPPVDSPSPVPTVGSDEPLSSKRKRTVQDYSALLRIRRRFPYHKESDGEAVVKRTRRNRSSPFSKPPELFPETPLPPTSVPPLLSPQKEPPTVVDPPAPESQDVPTLPAPENEAEGDVPIDLPTVVPPVLPVKPKKVIKRRGGIRPFNTSRRRGKKVVRRQPIKYVVVDDEEFAAAGGAAKLNKSAPSTPAKEYSTEADADGVSAPPTPTSTAGDGSVDPGTPDGPEPEARIIKRRRRRTFAHLQMIAAEAAEASTPTTSNGDEPLSKRKRTIHDYSMLLKTRPKFFFDIDAEQEKNVSPGRKRRSAERVAGIESLSSLLSPASPAAPEPSASVGRVVDEIEPKNVSIDVLMGLSVAPVVEVAKKSEPVPSTSTASGDGGPTSIATHRPIRRSSSQFARKSYVSPERVSDRRPPQSPYLQAKDILTWTKKFSIVVPELQISNWRHSDIGGLKGNSATLLLDNLDADYKPKSEHSGRSLGSSGGRRGSLKGDWRKEGGSLKSVERKPLGSRLTELDYANSEDEELLDIGYAPDKANSTSGLVTQKPRKSPVSSVSSSPSPSLILPCTLPSLSTAQLGPVKEVARRKPRLNNNRFWKRRPHGIRRVRISENGDSLPSPSDSAVPRARKILQKIKRRPGDLLSGLTLKRIKTIRTNLYRQGFRKRIIAEPALKDVSVDIISCNCGSTDEHGLMVQCEYCQCWQHGQCFEIENVSDMPKNYVCEACLYPDNVRSKKPSDYQYDFHKVGKLPRFAFGPPVNSKTTKLFQETNTLIQRVYQVREIIQTSRVHMNIMEAKPDHPKLYQWDKPHATIREIQQERKFNKVYRPLLRRLLYYNRDDPQYVTKLRAKVETVVKRRSFEERVKAEKRLNEKFPTIFPPPKVPVLPKRAEPMIVKPPVKEDKEAKRLEAEALRIRKELENGGKPKPVVPVRSVVGQDAAKVKTAGTPKSQCQDVEVKPKTEEGTTTDEQKEVRAVMETLLTNVEAIPISPVSNAEFKIPPAVTVTQEAKMELQHPPPPPPAFVPVDLGEEAPPEFPDFPEPESDFPLPASCPLTELKSSPTSAPPESNCPMTLPPGIVEIAGTSSSVPLPGTPNSTSVQDFSAVDLMHLDPSDPKFATIAEDLVKSCCEEPESLIKTLEDLANGTGGGNEGVPDLEGNDSDLLNFLDDALMDTFVAPPLSSSTISGFMDSKLMLPPPPPPPPIPSSSSFILPPAPPKLTRLTPELCRGNLILTILDQQRIIDQHLDEIEKRVVELEKMRGSDVSSRVAAFRRISILQTKVKKMQKAFEVMKAVGRKAEHSLHELIRFDPSRLDDGASESERDPEEMNNEETDSVEEEDDDEDLSEDELEDL